MPGKHHAKLLSQRPSVPHACAIISTSVSQRVRLLLEFRAAGLRTPTMGANRSTLSCRTILFLLVLLGTPLAARSGTLEGSAKELARKIVASLPAQDGVSLELRNTSTVTPQEFASLEQTLREELEGLKIHVVAAVPAAVNLRIVLSENRKGLLLSAEIIQAGASQVILMAASRTPQFRIASYWMPIVLQSKIIWEGPEQILDAAIASGPGGVPRLVLLLPDGLKIQDSPWGTMSTEKFPSSESATRDPRGKLEITGNVASAVLPPRICTMNLDTFELLECHTAAGADGSLMVEVPHDFPAAEKGTEILMPQNGCGAALATGPGDFTQPDSVQAFSMKPAGLAISSKVDFPGPVLALRGGSGSSRAIVRNLKTGNYEAYSLSCGK